MRRAHTRTRTGTISGEGSGGRQGALTSALTAPVPQDHPAGAMRGSDFDELGFFAAIEASGMRVREIAIGPVSPSR